MLEKSGVKFCKINIVSILAFFLFTFFTFVHFRTFHTFFLLLEWRRWISTFYQSLSILVQNVNTLAGSGLHAPGSPDPPDSATGKILHQEGPPSRPSWPTAGPTAWQRQRGNEWKFYSWGLGGLTASHAFSSCMSTRKLSVMFDLSTRSSATKMNTCSALHLLGYTGINNLNLQ